MRKETVKILFLGATSVKEAFYAKAQKIGALEFTDLSPERTEELQQIVHALKTLRSLSHTFEGRGPSVEKSGLKLAQCVIATEAQFEELKAREKLLTIEESRAAVFGNFSLEDVAFVHNHSKVRIRTFCHRPSHEVRENPALWFVGTDVEWDYFITLGDLPQVSSLVEINIRRSLCDVQKELELVRKELDCCTELLHSLVKSEPKLKAAYVKAANADHLERAENAASSNLDGHLFAATGYCDKDDISLFETWFQGLGIYTEIIDIEEGERAPTILKNCGLSAIGQDVIEVYDTPSLSDQDPSLWVLWSFACFFAMIISDAGYGMLLLCVTLYLKWRTKKQSAGLKRFWRLMTLLSSMSIAWGVLTASYFGMDFAPNSPIQKTSVIHWMVKKKVAYHMHEKDSVYKDWVRFYPSIAKLHTPEAVLMAAHKRLPSGRISYEMHTEFAQNLLMELAIVIGLVHVSLSLLRYAGRSPPAIGWVLFLVGGYLYFPSKIDATSALAFLFGFAPGPLATVGFGCLFGGLIVATALSFYKNRWSGFAEPMTALQLFADVLSYLRLYALALAGMILAGTFNDLGLRMSLWAGIPVIVLGHLINLTMAVLAAVIHGLRLNFLESYHYSFEGGGKHFQPLRRLEDGY